MPQWEHLVVDLNTISAKSSDVALLDQLGQERWELVSITSNKMAYMKRKVDELPPAPKRAPRRSIAMESKPL